LFVVVIKTFPLPLQDICLHKENDYSSVIAGGSSVMTGDTNESQILMNPSDVCTLLGIKESTLRKYALILKDAGYEFHVNDKGQRGYFEKDVIALKRFMEIKQSHDMTLEQAAEAVMAWVQQSNVAVRVMEKKQESERYNDDIKVLKEMVSQQNELLKELMMRLDQQQKYIEESLKKRDELLIQSLKESVETRKMIAAAKEEEEKAKKKGFWTRLFGK
jgi:DNA-binding transcriptional MerR regulator